MTILVGILLYLIVAFFLGVLIGKMLKRGREEDE